MDGAGTTLLPVLQIRDPFCPTERGRTALTGPEGVKKFILDVLVKIECPKEPYPGEAESKGTKAAETLSYRKFPLRTGHHFRRR
jgi:hypothetical protein